MKPDDEMYGFLQQVGHLTNLIGKTVAGADPDPRAVLPATMNAFAAAYHTTRMFNPDLTVDEVVNDFRQIVADVAEKEEDRVREMN